MPLGVRFGDVILSTVTPVFLIHSVFFIFWYSFDFGSLHTTVLSSEHSCGPGSKQRAWLEQDLASVDRAKTPWLVVELHRPMYTNEQAPDQIVAQMLQKQFEDLLIEYPVVMFIYPVAHCEGLQGERDVPDCARADLPMQGERDVPDCPVADLPMGALPLETR